MGPRVLRAVDWRRWRKEMRGVEGIMGPSELEHVAESAINEEEKMKMMMMMKMKKKEKGNLGFWRGVAIFECGMQEGLQRVEGGFI